jgi:hypothetical protein
MAWAGLDVGFLILVLLWVAMEQSQEEAKR